MKWHSGCLVVAISCQFGLPLHALAAPFLPTGQSADAVTFLDMGSIRAKSDEQRVWWITVAMHAPSRLPDAADVVATNLSFDCTLGEMRIVAINRYSADGKPIEIDSSVSDPMPVQPDTGFASMMDAVCDQKFNQADLIDGAPGFTMFDLSRVVKKVLN